MSDIDLSVGERIKKLRKAKGLVQRDLGILIGAANPQGIVHSYEAGRRGNKEHLNIATINKIANALGVSTAWLLTGHDDNVKPIHAIHSVPIIGWHDVHQWKLGIRENMSLSKCERVPHIVTPGPENENLFALYVERIIERTPFTPGDTLIIQPDLEMKDGNYVIAAVDENAEPEVFIYRKAYNTILPVSGEAPISIGYTEAIIYGVVVATHRKMI